MKTHTVVIVSPALADANNGNWQTAQRWRGMLAGQHAVRVVRDWPDAAAKGDQVMLALHARKSAGAVRAWVQAHGQHRLGLVLTGTDLYRDIHQNPVAAQSLELANCLVVLQDQGIAALPPAVQHKARVLYQSVATRQTLKKTQHHLRALMVGHLREEKDPLTWMASAHLLREETGLRLDHIGAGLDPDLAQAAQQAMQDCPAYRWLGALSHAQTLHQIQRAHVLVHASHIEGGAHVVMEAVCSGTPVLASRIPGNVGMLGVDYAGYFECGDTVALAGLLRQCRDSLQNPDPGGLLPTLQRQCASRCPLFAPSAENAAVRKLVDDLWNT